MGPVAFLTKASADPGPIIFVLATSAWYVVSVRQFRRSGQDWPWLRSVWFALGEVSIVAAVISGLGAFDRTNFVVQAVQYSVVGMGAPVMFALAAPVTLAFRTGGPRTRAAIQAVVYGRPSGWLTNPLVTWPLYFGPLFTLYLTSVCWDGIRHPVIDQVIYLVLFVTGFVFCWAIVGVDPIARRPGYWFRIAYGVLTLAPYSILGMAVESARKPIGPGIHLVQMQTGGGVFWVIGDSISLLGVIAIWVLCLRTDEGAARRYDEATEVAADEQLAHWRATRDAAARTMST